MTGESLKNLAVEVNSFSPGINLLFRGTFKFKPKFKSKFTDRLQEVSENQGQLITFCAYTVGKSAILCILKRTT